jgi:hypothetical protein
MKVPASTTLCLFKTLAFFLLLAFIKVQEADASPAVESSSVIHSGPIRLLVVDIHRGGGLIPAGYHPLGYKMTALGEIFLAFDGSMDSDVGRFLASLKQRKSMNTIKGQWLEVVRVAKNAQSMRIYRKLPDLIDFCINAGLMD